MNELQNKGLVIGRIYGNIQVYQEHNLSKEDMTKKLCLDKETIDIILDYVENMLCHEDVMSMKNLFLCYQKKYIEKGILQGKIEAYYSGYNMSIEEIAEKLLLQESEVEDIIINLSDIEQDIIKEIKEGKGITIHKSEAEGILEEISNYRNPQS